MTVSMTVYSIRLPMRPQVIQGERVQVEVEPDPAGTADQVGFRHEAPDPAVRAVVAIIADHQVVASRHRHFLVVISVAEARMPARRAICSSQT